MNQFSRLTVSVSFSFVISMATGQRAVSNDLTPIPERLVVLTFDDANKSDRTFVADVLKQHGFGATFYITEGLGFLHSKDNYTTWNEIRELHEMGFEIGNHSQHHRNVARLLPKEFSASLQHIDARCAEYGIPRPSTFCYPGFQHSLSAVQVVHDHGFQFARRGVGPEFPDSGEGARGPAYDPAIDHPLLIPTTGYAGPKWSFDDLRWAVDKARDGRICVLCFHGVPAVEHPWVTTKPNDFKKYMQYLKDQGCTVIAMRDLAKYVDSSKRPEEPYKPIRRRLRTPIDPTATRIENKLGLDLVEYRFAWQSYSKQSRQSAYQILVASSEGRLAVDVGDLWDSGRVDSSGTDVRYFGQPLPRGQNIWWKVRIWHGHDAGPYSVASKVDVPPRKPIARRRRSFAAKANLNFVKGVTGMALRFDEQSPMIELPDYPTSDNETGLTISAWIQPTSTPDDWQTIFRKEDGNQRRLLAIGRTGDIWGLWIGLGVSGHYVEVGADVPTDQLGNGAWHHVAGSYDGKEIDLYIDGKRVGGGVLDGTLNPAAGVPAFIGAYGDRLEPFYGLIDEVRVDHRALASEEIERIAKGEPDIATEATAGYWKLDGELKNEIEQPVSAAPPARVVFLGNTLIANMNRYGYLETALTIHWPHHDITFRNLGWPADDVFGTARSEFGSDHNTGSWQPPSSQHGFGFHELLRQVDDAQPSTIIVGYGTETAFCETAEEFARFKNGYRQLLDSLAANGVHLVLLGPPRQEYRAETPDLTARNKRLKATNDFIRKTARKRGYPFIDLYEHLIPASQPAPGHTENGIHLNEQAYRRLSQLVMEGLGLVNSAPRIELSHESEVISCSGGRVENIVKTQRGVRFDVTSDVLQVEQIRVANAKQAHRLTINGESQTEDAAENWSRGVAPTASPTLDQVEQLRQTIIEKNRLAGYRLRPLNKAYIFLFRRHEMGHLAYEMRDFERLVGVKEERIARLRVPRTLRYAIERIDSWKSPRAYPDHEVPRRIPAPDIKAERMAFTVADGLEINLFAANPMIANPINLNWDTRGRAWVSTSSTYPHIKPGREPNDRIVILTDRDNDGRADESTLFAEGLLVPHSVMPVQGGAYVCSATELLFLADTDGDDRADERRVLFSGFGNADVHHMIHGLRWSPWGELYFAQSIYINSFVETRWGPRRLNGSGIWRFRPETERLDIFARGMVNPWGHAFDPWGQSFCTDGAGGSGPHYVFDGAAFQSAVGADRILDGLIPGKPKNTAAEFVSGRHLPKRWHGSLLANDFRANRTVRYEIEENGSGYKAAEVETVLHSSHRSFRPVDIKMGPEGAIYIVDWYNPIIDHGEVDFHHPQRDRSHGRIWRLTAKEKPTLEPPRIIEADIATLLDWLKEPEEWTRTQAKRELTRRDRDEVLAALSTWLDRLDTNGQQVEHSRLEALWLHGALQAPNEELLEQVSTSTDHRVRAAAVRMAFHWQSELNDAITMLAQAVEDDHPRVRLEAVNALRNIGTLEAANVALRALYYPVDKDLDYALWLTARETQGEWLPALQSGKPLFDGKVERIAFALSASTDRQAMTRLVALVRDGKVKREDRPNLLRTIAGLGGATELRVALEIAAHDPTLLPAMVDGAIQNQHTLRNASALVDFLNHENAQVRSAAATLVGHWKVASAKSQLAALAENETYAFADRMTATTALAQLGEFGTLKHWADAKSFPLRIAAIAAWASEQPEEASGSAVQFLQEIADAESSVQIYNAFVERKNGPAVLTKALADTKLSADVAAVGIRVALASGREMKPLIDALTISGSLQPVSNDLPIAERGKLLADAQRVGNIERGERIFARKDLACLKCHMVRNVGGKLGPDLTTVGAYMTPESLLDSILNPSRAIKQGYETTLVVRNSGRVVSGSLQRKTETAVIIRDQEGKIVSIPNDDIESIDTSPISLMPQGLAAKLRRDELVDLMRYLTSRGKKRN